MAQAQAVCRCGTPLRVQGEGLVRVICPGCGARVKIRVREEAPTTVPSPPPETPDPFIRFYCPCGRRLKVHAADRLSHGKCPECGQIVPVPPPPVPAGFVRHPQGAGDPETPTADLEPADREIRDRWCREHLVAAAPPPGSSGPVPIGSTTSAPRISVKSLSAGHVEAGLRLCPGCGKPVHMQADTCRHCGTAVPRR